MIERIKPAFPFRTKKGTLMTSAAMPRSPAFAATERDEGARALFDIIYRLSFGRGDVTLASGEEEQLLFRYEAIDARPSGGAFDGEGFLAEVLAVGGEYVGGLEMGAVSITGAICQLSYTAGTPVSGFFVRKKAKEHGAKKLIEGLKAGETLRGKKSSLSRMSPRAEPPPSSPWKLAAKKEQTSASSFRSSIAAKAPQRRSPMRGLRSSLSSLRRTS